MSAADFADIAALFNVTADSLQTNSAPGRDLRDLSTLEVAGIGGGEGVSMWG